MSGSGSSVKAISFYFSASGFLVLMVKEREREDFVGLWMTTLLSLSADVEDKIRIKKEKVVFIFVIFMYSKTINQTLFQPPVFKYSTMCLVKCRLSVIPNIIY